MSIATKTGDKGTTGLMFNRRVSKSDLRIECNGLVDELNAALGLARAHLRGTKGDPFITEPILRVQNELVGMMGEIAVAPGDRERYVTAGYTTLSAAMVKALTAAVDDLEKKHHTAYRGWAMPGGSVAGAALDMARTVCRRAERGIVAVFGADAAFNPEIVRYLNRLSDLCWLWARWMEAAEEHRRIYPQIDTD